MDKEVEDTSAVAPLVVVLEEVSGECEGRPGERQLTHETSLTKFLFREIPAFASKIEEWVSPFMSLETTSSSV